MDISGQQEQLTGAGEQVNPKEDVRLDSPAKDADSDVRTVDMELDEGCTEDICLKNNNVTDEQKNSNVSKNNSLKGHLTGCLLRKPPDINHIVVAEVFDNHIAKILVSLHLYYPSMLYYFVKLKYDINDRVCLTDKLLQHLRTCRCIVLGILRND